MEDIRENIRTIIANGELRDKMIKLGLSNAQKYRPEIVADKYLELYKKVIDINRREA